MRNIVFIADKNYYMPTIVAIRSLLDAKVEKMPYTVYCICRGLDGKQYETLRAMSDEDNKVIPLDADEIMLERAAADNTTFGTHAKKSALLKFELADIFDTLDTILYLDGDMIIKGDIAPIFETQLGEHYLAAVYDNGKFYSNKIPDINPNQYFNSGMMLLNLKKMRENNIRQKLYETKEKSDNNFFMDQNVFNVVFADQAIMLPVRFNCQYTQIDRKRYLNKLTVEEMNRAYGDSYKDWEAFYDDMRILHYTTPAKPWKYADASAVEIWDKYYDRCKNLFEAPLQRKKLHRKFLFSWGKIPFLRIPARFLIEAKTRGFMTAIKRNVKR